MVAQFRRLIDRIKELDHQLGGQTEFWRCPMCGLVHGPYPAARPKVTSLPDGNKLDAPWRVYTTCRECGYMTERRKDA